MSEIHTKVLIIGSGPAGYTAAIYAARGNMQPVMTTGMQPGGQLIITTDVENYPGFADVIQGPWLMEQMQAQAKHVGTDIRYDTIRSVDFSKRPFVCVGESDDVYIAESVIISTGAQARWLGIPTEETYRGFGVSGCATCDGFFFKGADIAVIGGGNSALEEALYLTNHARKVTIIHRRDSFRGEKMLQDRLFTHPQIDVIWDHQVIEIKGQENPKAVTSLILENVKNGEHQELPVSGVFVAIGHTPATEIFKGKVDMDPAGYILCKPNSTHTSVAGVFAAGDVQDSVYRQAVTAAGQGCMAALDAQKFLSH